MAFMCLNIWTEAEFHSQKSNASTYTCKKSWLHSLKTCTIYSYNRCKLRSPNQPETKAIRERDRFVRLRHSEQLQCERTCKSTMLTLLENPTYIWNIARKKPLAAGFIVQYLQYTHRVLHYVSLLSKTTTPSMVLTKPAPAGVKPYLPRMLSLDDLNSFIFPGVLRKIPAQVMQITTPPNEG